MKKFSFQRGEILTDIIRITPFIAEDERGNFIKDYAREIFLQNDLSLDLQEVFYTTSKRGVIRAIHFQNTKQQGKLVRVLVGKVYDVCVDLRVTSPTFGQWEGFYLSADNPTELYVPRGFGHGYLVLQDAIVSYKCDEKFYAEYDDGIFYADTELGIAWPLEDLEQIILSDKDKNLQSFAEYKCRLSNE